MRPHEVPHLLGDPTKANILLQWKPQVTFEGLSKIMYEADLKKVSETELTTKEKINETF